MIAKDRLGDLVGRFRSAAFEKNRALKRIIRDSSDIGLTWPQFRLLQLCQSTDMRVTEIAEELGFQPSAVTAMVDRLAARGLIERERCKEDRRVIYTRLTETGEEHYWRLEGRINSALSSAMDQYSTDEVEGFVEMYENVQRWLAEAQVGVDV
jgi:MarR family transcriptional regulator, organic hydroperoxide resistance regulator